MRVALSILSITALSACEPAPTATPPQDAPQIKRLASTTPGDLAVTGHQAASLFARLCGIAPKGRAAVETAAASNGFVLHTGLDAYMHEARDVTVTLREDGRCSIVFVTEQNARTIKAAFETLNSPQRPITVRDQGVILGEQYYTAIM